MMENKGQTYTVAAAPWPWPARILYAEIQIIFGTVYDCYQGEGSVLKWHSLRLYMRGTVSTEYPAQLGVTLKIVRFNPPHI